MQAYDVVIVGGGLFGIVIALTLSRRYKTLVIERNRDILTEASYINQNRLHSGFHYPRSLDTARESLDGYDLFVERFGDCVRPCESYYAVAAEGSLTSPDQYDEFLEALSAHRPVEHRRLPSPPPIFQPDAIAAAYQVKEDVCDMGRVRRRLKEELAASSAELALGVEALAIEGDSPYVVSTANGAYQGERLINAAYGNLNWHGHPCAPKLEVQLVEMVEVSGPPDIPAITVVDGPFCSILPFGHSRSSYWHYSVNYAVHARVETRGPVAYKEPFYTNWPRMVEQGKRYFTFMDDLSRTRSHFTARTFVADPEVERAAARPSMIYELQDGLYQVLGGKLVTCVSLARKLAGML